MKTIINKNPIPNALIYHLKSIFTFNVLIIKIISKTDVVNKEIVVAIAAPITPNQGMSRIFNMIFTVAETLDFFISKSGRPAPAQDTPTARLVLPCITVPTSNINNGEIAGIKSFPNIKTIMSFAKNPTNSPTPIKVQAECFMLLSIILCNDECLFWVQYSEVAGYVTFWIALGINQKNLLSVTATA